MPSDTAALFAPSADKFDSRSLLLDRFVYDLQDPKMDEARRLNFGRVCEDSFKTIQTTRNRWEKERSEARNDNERRKLTAFLDDTAPMARPTSVIGPAEASKATMSRQSFLESVASKNIIIYAQLQSRLMVNMAGGVMENAGLCLDRFGLPYIPGSAVKGCARRAALAALHEWCETGQKPGVTEPDKDNLFKAACDSFTTQTEMLAAIARVFGWCEQDWKTRAKVLKGVTPKRDEDDARFQQRCQKLWEERRSDFAWACGDALWGTVREEAMRLLERARVSRAASGVPPDAVNEQNSFSSDASGRTPEAAGQRLALPKDFAGSVCFLPACPVDLGKTDKVDGLPLAVPPLGKLELDVVTCHHREYYDGNPQYATAPDTEEPNPVVFPAVAPGHVLTFALAPLRGADASLVAHARAWLKTGLETFGLGAKTNAGYGWFQACDTVQKVVGDILHQRKKERRAAEAKAEAERKAAEAKAAKEKAEQERLAIAPLHEKAKVEYGKLGDEPFAAQAKEYDEMNDEQRHGFILAMKERRETAKRWAKKKPELVKPWQQFAQRLQPPIQLP